MSCLITMSQKELHRLEVIQKIRDERLSVVQGANPHKTHGNSSPGRRHDARG